MKCACGGLAALATVVACLAAAPALAAPGVKFQLMMHGSEFGTGFDRTDKLKVGRTVVEWKTAWGEQQREYNLLSFGNGLYGEGVRQSKTRKVEDKTLLAQLQRTAFFDVEVAPKTKMRLCFSHSTNKDETAVWIWTKSARGVWINYDGRSDPRARTMFLTWALQVPYCSELEYTSRIFGKVDVETVKHLRKWNPFN